MKSLLSNFLLGNLKSKSVLMILGLSLGVVLGLSCTYPDTFWAPLLVFVSLFVFWKIVLEVRPHSLVFFFIGIGFHASAMWWLMSTVSRFGGFPMWIAFFILVLYCLASSLQFLLASIFARYLRKFISIPSAFILSWMVLEICFPRLFPWGLGNFFVKWIEITAYSELVGERGLSFIVLILSYLFYQCFEAFKANNIKGILVFPLVAIFIFLGGDYLNQRAELRFKNGTKGSALLVQGNLSTAVKGEMSYLSANLETYQNLSSKFIELEPEVDFVVWPETVFSTWSSFLASGEYASVRFDPYPDFSKPLIYGALGYDRYGPKEKDVKLYNASFLRKADGTIGGAYAKRVLMPFGEYVPFASTFPFLLDIVQLGGAFSVGPINVPMEIGKARVGVLICYEDLVSDLAREYNREGANLLLNITNDAWYGDSPASRQHDLLARFRALETRTYLLRSTNTGFTSVIDPFGRVVSSLPSFSEDVLKAEYVFSESVTFYSLYGLWPLWGMLGVVLLWGREINRKAAKNAKTAQSDGEGG